MKVTVPERSLIEVPCNLGNELANPAVSRIVLQQGAPSHLELQRGNIEGAISHHYTRIVLF
jgi:hypothetical protein